MAGIILLILFVILVLYGMDFPSQPKKDCPSCKGQKTISLVHDFRDVDDPDYLGEIDVLDDQKKIKKRVGQVYKCSKCAYQLQEGEIEP